MAHSSDPYPNLVYDLQSIQRDTREKVAEWARRAWDAFQVPDNPGARITFTPFEDESVSIEQKRETEAASLLYIMDKYYLDADKAKVLKAVDSITGNTMGGIIFTLHDLKPYVSTEPETAEWHPAGPQREYAASMLDGLGKYHVGAMKNMPHIDINFLWVHPDFRRIGVATVLLAAADEDARRAAKAAAESAIKRAPKKAPDAGAAVPSLGIWAQVDDMAYGLFERCGYVKVDRQFVKAATACKETAATAEWRRMKRLVADVSQTLMWKGEMREDGQFPWQGEDEWVAEQTGHGGVSISMPSRLTESSEEP